MGCSWVKPPKFEATLKKRGLEPHEFESVLVSKLSNIFEHHGVAINGCILETVKELKKRVCFRENRINPYLDQRNRDALREYTVVGMLANLRESPMQRRQRTAGIRGRTRFDRVQIDLYHDRQHRLFLEDNLLGEKFRDLFPSIVLKEDPKGFFFHQDGTRFTIEDACRVIDKFTSEFIRYLMLLLENNGQVPPGEWAPQNIPEIRSRCQLILMGRRVVDWATENDLLDHKGCTEWQNHLFIEVSYAALLVVLDMIIKQQQAVAVVVLDMIPKAAASRKNKTVGKFRFWSVMFTIFPKLIGFAFIHYSRY